MRADRPFVVDVMEGIREVQTVRHLEQKLDVIEIVKTHITAQIRIQTQVTTIQELLH